MQASQWTTDIIVITAVIAAACALVGFFASALRQGRQLSSLAAQLEQAKQAQASAAADSASVAEQLRLTNERYQALQLTESELKARLQSSAENITRVTEEQQQSKNDNAALQLRLEQATLQHHDAARRLEAVQAEGRAQQDRINDLRERLQQGEETNQQLHADRDRLKDELAGEGKRAKSLETAERDLREQLAESKQQLRERAEAFAGLQQQFKTLSSEHTALQTTLQKREEHFQEQMSQLADTRKSLTQEFENLANKIFEEKGKTFTQTSQTSIDGMLKPFREQIDGFQKRINEVHDASLQGNTSLNAEIRKVLDIGMQMSKEANNLTSALKGDSQQRGAWGEAQLRRTLEMSGLVEDAHYEVQSAFKDADGRSKQTDYLIKLPDGKHIIIDSKVSLVAYDRAVAAESVEDQQLAMAEHVKAVRKHIDDLASKDYTNLVGMHSPDFVLMFMPIEPAYIEAMKHNKDLFEYGYKKHIVLVSHTTLIPILRTVSNLWMIERSNAEAREISEKAGDIYNQVCTVAERLAKLGGTLNTASNHYNNTVKALAGQQGLYGKVDRFSQLSAKVSKSLPALDPTHMDFETERLSLIVEAIEEPQLEVLPHGEKAPANTLTQA
ncbi:DNA recombination protein RmuC [Halopseudomonas maritima]|uniref:DNA recombination protein RmuC n=1 Tax=Halopseudomonas maritima TaxID=2918528 RepID=UPI001EEAEA57|nr:DNA recombination protein RmuC [Halopseudomonas maritima]UJJ31825.1 DNA recombination protein RmuC [Halopseudomonas maritima]